VRRASFGLNVLLSLFALTGCERSKATADAPSAAHEPAAAPSAEVRPMTADGGPLSAAAPREGSVPPITAAQPGKVTMISDEEARALAGGSNAFAFELWRALREGSAGNLAVSPASISLAFAMTYGGARGPTAAQMKKVFHFTQPPEALGRAWGSFGQTLTASSRPITLRVANRLFGEKTYPFVPAFVESTRADFGAALEPVDFKGAPDAVRQRVNAWVEDQTEKRIKDLLSPGSLTPLTRLVLVNAIYFLGNWDQPFARDRTAPAPFHAKGGAEKSVPMMHETGQLAVGRAAGVKVLELPYKGRSASLFVVLPDKTDGLAAVEASLTSAQLKTWTSAVAGRESSVSLPRFEIAGEGLPLSSALSALGMPLAFDAKSADFTGIGAPPEPDEHLHVDEAFHKAFVKIDEQGTEAAAATAAVMGARGEPPPPPFEFTADHPFLFFIVDKPSGLVLFMGRVTDP
jgi:serpin B